MRDADRLSMGSEKVTVADRLAATISAPLPGEPLADGCVRSAVMPQRCMIAELRAVVGPVWVTPAPSVATTLSR
jgi:hypothetical protein